MRQIFFRTAGSQNFSHIIYALCNYRGQSKNKSKPGIKAFYVRFKIRAKNKTRPDLSVHANP